MRFYLTFVILLILYSCTSKQGKNEVNVDASEIKSERILPEVFLGIPVAIDYIEKNLIIREIRSDYLYKLVSLESAQVVKFVKKGKGPEEVFDGILLLNDSLKELKVHCQGYRKTLYYDVDSLLNNNISPKKIISSNLKNEYFLLNAQEIGEDKYLGRIISNVKENPYAVLNVNFENVQTSGFFLNDVSINKIHPITKGMLFQGRTIYNPNLNVGFTFFRNCDGYEKFEVIDSNVVIEKQIINSVPKFETNKLPGHLTILNNNNNKIGYIDVTHSCNFIYALYSVKGKKRSKALQNHSNIVRVFTWKGEFVKQLILDIDIDCITCCNDDYLIGISNVDVPKIYKFKL